MRASIIRLLSGLLFLVSCFVAQFAATQEAGPPSANMDRGPATLLVEGPAKPGETVDLAIRFQPVEGWHGYWSNPGDAGQGMSLKWDLPDGWSVGTPQYPVPHRLLISGIMNHVFEGEHAVLIPLSVPLDTVEGTFDISVRADWLTCSDTLCVPQWATLKTQVTVGQTASTDSRFNGWRARLAPQLDRSANFEIAGSKLRLAIPLPASVALSDPHIFIATANLIDYAAPQSFSRDGDTLIAEIPLKMVGQGPTDLEAILAFDKDSGVRFSAQSGEVPPPGEPIVPSNSEIPSIWILLAGALAGGLLLNVMPCVFPILSLKALTLARAGESGRQARMEGLSYTAGVVLACTSLGALMLVLRAGGEQVGWAFQLQEPWVVIVLLMLASAITANFAGVFELPSVSVTRSGEPASAFATGLLAAFVATPCTGPFMAAALGAALLLPPVYALLLFAVLGVGLALPFLLIGFVPALRRVLPKPGAWMERFRRIMAIPMGLTALALLWLTTRIGGKPFAAIALVVIAGLIIALMVAGRLQKHGKLAWPAFALVAAPFAIFAAFALPASYAVQTGSAEGGMIDARPFSRQALAAARASDKPVFLWFTADWCVTCKVNEQVAIERETTRDAFKKAGVVALVGDWTRRDEEITAFLTERGVAGVPLYLWYEPGQDGDVLPQVLTPDLLSELASRPRSSARPQAPASPPPADRVGGSVPRQ